MTLPATGTISMAQVNTELGRAATANTSLNESAVRSLFGKPSGAISMSDGRGKSSYTGQNPQFNEGTSIYTDFWSDNCIYVPIIQFSSRGNIVFEDAPGVNSHTMYVPNIYEGEGMYHEVRFKALNGYPPASVYGSHAFWRELVVDTWSAWLTIGNYLYINFPGTECISKTTRGSLEIRNKVTLATVSTTYRMDS